MMELWVRVVREMGGLKGLKLGVVLRVSAQGNTAHSFLTHVKATKCTYRTVQKSHMDKAITATYEKSWTALKWWKWIIMALVADMTHPQADLHHSWKIYPLYNTEAMMLPQYKILRWFAKLPSENDCTQNKSFCRWKGYTPVLSCLSAFPPGPVLGNMFTSAYS